MGLDLGPVKRYSRNKKEADKKTVLPLFMQRLNLVLLLRLLGHGRRATLVAHPRF